MPVTTMLDIVKINGSDRVVGLIEESIHASPEVMLGGARTIKGTSYKTLIRTAVGQGGFRNANEGRDPQKSTWVNKMVETYIADCAAEMDKATADAHEDGPAALLALEQEGNLEGQFRALGSQFYYGTDTSFATSTADGYAKAFPGLVQTVDSTMVLNAGGTTADTGSSAWGVKFGPKDVRWVLGMDGMIENEDPRLTRLTDANGKPYDGYRAPLLFWIGLQLVNKNSLAQIKNLTEDSGKGLDDDKLYQMLSLYPSGVRPDAIFLTRRSLEQLRQSRTATTTSGTPAPTPTNIDGIPLVPTDNIVNTETLVA